jgi:UPF0716 family protein affecting phage T7 exclusion
MKLRYIIFSLLLLPFLEFAFFGVFSDKIGIIFAFIALFGTSMFGFYLLKSQGRLLVKTLKAGSSMSFTAENARKGLGTAFAALLFAFPGFLTDIAGVILLLFTGALPLPIVKRETRNDGIIDLAPDEWQEKIAPKPRKKRIK